jgi:hypothetical protein
MCRGRRARILLHLHIQLEGTVLRGSRGYPHEKGAASFYFSQTANSTSDVTT